MTDEEVVPVPMEPVEPKSERVRRHNQRGRLYVGALSIIVLLVIIVALAVQNDHRVKVSWIFGTGHPLLVWIILLAAIIGWLIGVGTSFFFRLRTRRRRSLS